MNHRLLFISLLFAAAAAAQDKLPIALSNAYTLSDADGYAGFNHTNIIMGRSGKVYTRSYDGDVVIHGNNYSIPMPALSRLPVASGSFLEISADTAWYYDDQRVAVIVKDSVRTAFLWPQRATYCVAGANVVLWLNQKAKGQKTFFFDGRGIHPVKAEPRLSDRAVVNALADSALYLCDWRDGVFYIYRFHRGRGEWQPLCQHRMPAQLLVGFQDCNNFTYFTRNLRYRRMVNGVPGQPLRIAVGDYPVLSMQPALFPLAVTAKNRPLYTVANLQTGTTGATLYSRDNIGLADVDKTYGSFFMASGNKPMRVFQTVKKYPWVFDGAHSQSLFALTEDSTGGIWAGNYQGGISRIFKGKANSFPQIKNKIINGSIAHGNKVYMISENHPVGLLQIDAAGNVKHLTDSVYGFYTYISRDKQHFYYGGGYDKGLWISDLNALDKGQPAWTKVSAAQGLNVHNILTITEDSLGRIWCGHPKRSVAVYHPGGTAKTWLVEKGETPFGPMSSITDRWGTVWLGTGSKGLWYYNDYRKEASPVNCKPVRHPFFNSTATLSALTIYKDWLVIAATDKILLLQLDSFHRNNQIILRYLNPQEAAFTSVTEQNTMLTSGKDGTVWFSTGDMLYNWDIANWLALPQYKVVPQLLVNAGGKVVETFMHTTHMFDAGVQSFDVELRYLSPDGMPRFTAAALVKTGDSVVLPLPSRESRFSIKNISSGAYRFVVEVYETDGRIYRYAYPITIEKFLWQRWWFWAAITAAALLVFAYFIDLRRHKQLAEQTAKTKEAELHLLKTEADKKLAGLQLKTLSSQFRPHFILNSLNTIGAQMDDKPEAESVLSRLGESVNLIFNHTLEQKVLHTFAAEWRLTVNVIHIHRLIYLKGLETELPTLETLDAVRDVQLPLGLLQIHVENALLHGLNNRAGGPWRLTIGIGANEDFITVTIADNGVGRRRSAALSNFNKHGTGTKNLAEVIRIINSYNAQKIAVTYRDDIYLTNGEAYGTEVTITVPKNLRYGPA